MKFYRVDTRSAEMCSEGFHWFTSRKEAERCKREWETEACTDRTHFAEVETFTVQPNKKGILRALNHYASYPDNG